MQAAGNTKNNIYILSMPGDIGTYASYLNISYTIQQQESAVFSNPTFPVVPSPNREQLNPTDWLFDGYAPAANCITDCLNLYSGSYYCGNTNNQGGYCCASGTTAS